MQFTVDEEPQETSQNRCSKASTHTERTAQKIRRTRSLSCVINIFSNESFSLTEVSLRIHKSEQYREKGSRGAEEEEPTQPRVSVCITYDLTNHQVVLRKKNLKLL